MINNNQDTGLLTAFKGFGIVDVNYVHKGKSFLEYAIENNKFESIFALIQLGATVTPKNKMQIISSIISVGNYEYFLYFTKHHEFNKEEKQELLKESSRCLEQALNDNVSNLELYYKIFNNIRTL